MSLARICVASIRHWYPEIPIYLIKDEKNGKFDTSTLEKYWDVKVFNNQTPFTHGIWTVLAPMLTPGEDKCLVIDADIVFVGYVLDLLNESTEDFVINVEYKEEGVLNTENFTNYNFNYHKLKEFDPAYKFQGYTFNAGQIVFTEGKLQLDDLNGLVEYGSGTIVNKYPEIFTLDDQSLLIYILHKKEQMKKATIGKRKFMVWPKYEKEAVSTDDINDKAVASAYIMHWAGICEFKYISRMTYSNVLRYYNDFYYSRVRFGKCHRIIDQLKLHYVNLRRIQPRIPYLLGRKKMQFVKWFKTLNA